MKIIDPHIHLFDLTRGEYHWLQPENPPFWKDKSIISRNFSINDLQLSPFELSGFVHIEAGFDNLKPWREIAWLESLKTTIKVPFRTIACINLTLNSDAFSKQLEQIKQFDSVVGCRHILDDDAQTLLSNPQVLANLKTLANNQLLFELQMPFSHTHAVNLVDNALAKNPKLTVVINHAGSPSDNKSEWQANLKCIANHANCFIKCSGWEMENRQFFARSVNDTINTCIALFGIHRVMLASNFPLVLMSQPYESLWQHYMNDMPLTDAELSALVFENAKRIYRL